MIVIVDYGSGNVSAIMNVLRRSKLPHLLSSDPRDFESADRFILPGVGAFDPTMENLTKSGIAGALHEQVLGNGKKVLGICVGMHLLAEGSDEGDMPGLGWISGRVRRIDSSRLRRPLGLPHMGWNSIQISAAASLFDGVEAERGFYFLHSYFFDAADRKNVAARVEYGMSLPCAVERANVFGVQFHPEKSHANGTRLFENFARLG